MTNIIKMKILIFSCLLACIFVIVSSIGDHNMLGPGKWYVLNVMKCTDDQLYKYKFDISRKKVNRTHDGFNAWLKLDNAIDDKFAVRIDICKYVDGGCKPYQVMADDSFCRFVNKYAKDNFEKALIMSNIDPPNCPIPPGEHSIKQFIFDYGELPNDGMYGQFGAKVYLIENGVEMTCVDMTVEFKQD